MEESNSSISKLYNKKQDYLTHLAKVAREWDIWVIWIVWLIVISSFFPSVNQHKFFHSLKKDTLLLFSWVGFFTVQLSPCQSCRHSLPPEPHKSWLLGLSANLNVLSWSSPVTFWCFSQYSSLSGSPYTYYMDGSLSLKHPPFISRLCMLKVLFPNSRTH